MKLLDHFLSCLLSASNADFSAITRIDLCKTFMGTRSAITHGSGLSGSVNFVEKSNTQIDFVKMELTDDF